MTDTRAALSLAGVRLSERHTSENADYRKLTRCRKASASQPSRVHVASIKRAFHTPLHPSCTAERQLVRKRQLFVPSNDYNKSHN